MVDIARRTGVLDQAVFISLDWGTVERIVGRDPAVHIGYVVDDEARVDEAIERATDVGRAFIDLDAALALQRPGIVERMLARDLDVGVWTVNSPAEADALLALGVTRFTTDEVEALTEWKRSRED